MPSPTAAPRPSANLWDEEGKEPGEEGEDEEVGCGEEDGRERVGRYRDI